MATTLEKIGAMCDQIGWKYRREDKDGAERIVLLFGTGNYRHRSADKNFLLLTVELGENGELLTVSAPEIYLYKEGPHKLAVLQALMMTSYRSKSLQWEYDSRDGEIRAVVEVPLEDSELTTKQFKRIAGTIPDLVDRYHSVITRALETGVVDFDQPAKGPAPLGDLFEMLQKLPPERRTAVLEEIKRRQRAQEAPTAL